MDISVIASKYQNEINMLVQAANAAAEKEVAIPAAGSGNISPVYVRLHDYYRIPAEELLRQGLERNDKIRIWEISQYEMKETGKMFCPLIKVLEVDKIYYPMSYRNDRKPQVLSCGLYTKSHEILFDKVIQKKTSEYVDRWIAANLIASGCSGL